jgi:hypothetical protein
VRPEDLSPELLKALETMSPEARQFLLDTLERRQTAERLNREIAEREKAIAETRAFSNTNPDADFPPVYVSSVFSSSNTATLPGATVTNVARLNFLDDMTQADIEFHRRINGTVGKESEE